MIDLIRPRDRPHRLGALIRWRDGDPNAKPYPMDSRKLPPFHSLLAFEAVARHRSFSRAADELCITHSAVSHRIRLLEESYGTKLLQRNSQGVALTHKGTEFLEAVLESLAILHTAAEKLSVVGREVVKLGLGHAFARSWLVERLGGFYRAHQDVDLDIYSVANADCVSMLRKGAIDVAVIYGKAADWEEFESIEIFKTRMFPVCSPGYLASNGEPQEPDDLLAATLLRLPTQPWKPWFKAAGLKVSDNAIKGPMFHDADLMLNAAVGGHGIALARDILADYDLTTGRLVRLFDLSIPSDSGYRVVYLANAKPRADVATFINWIVATARQPAGEP